MLAALGQCFADLNGRANSLLDLLEGPILLSLSRQDCTMPYAAISFANGSIEDPTAGLCHCLIAEIDYSLMD